MEKKYIYFKMKLSNGYQVIRSGIIDKTIIKATAYGRLRTYKEKSKGAS